MNDILCVIPARGGSKGIPKKNLQEICGKSLLSHSIEYVINEGINKDKIIVSSDDKNILSAAKKYKVVCHQRPSSISGDASATELALIDACKSYPGVTDVITLQPTSPIRFKGRLQECVKKYRSKNYDSLLTTTKLYNFFWYEVKIKSHYEWESTCPGQRPMREQLTREDFKYFDNGNLYISNIQMLFDTGCRLGEKVCVFPITQLEGMQIDTPEDLDIMRRIFNGLKWNNVK